MAYYKCGKIFATQNSNTSIETASGAIANFRTSLAMPVLSCDAEFSATQDLHGQSAPYPAGGSAQIWDEEWEVGGYNNSGEKTTNANIIRCKNPITVPNGAKVYINCGTAGVTFRLVTYDKDGNCLSSQTVQNPNRTYTFDSNVASIAFNFDTNYGNTYKNNISINYPSTETAYHPYSNICPIVGVDKVNVTRTGKNLLSMKIYDGGSYNPAVGTQWNLTESTNEFTRNGNAYSITTSSTWRYFTVLMPLKSGIDYFMHMERASTGSDAVSYIYLDKDFKVLAVANNTQTPYTTNSALNPPANTAYYALVFTNRSTANCTITITNPYVIVGSEVTDFEAYQGTTALVNLGGTYYGGSVDAVTGKITLTHKFVEFDGSEDENWVFNSKNEANNWVRYVISVTDIAICENTDLQNRCYSNIFEKTNANTIIQTVNVNKIAVISNQRLLISLPNTTAQTVTDLRAWLANNITDVVYLLATPLVVYASNTAEIPTIVGDNQVFADTGDVEVKYRKLHSDN